MRASRRDRQSLRSEALKNFLLAQKPSAVSRVLFCFPGFSRRFFSSGLRRFFSGVCSDGFASEACRIRFLILAAASAAFFETCPALRSCRFSFLAFLTRVPPGRFRRVPGGTVNVLKRRRAALPHPAECSTIAVPGLSFQVRNGCWAFPPGCDRRKS